MTIPVIPSDRDLSLSATGLDLAAAIQAEAAARDALAEAQRSHRLARGVADAAAAEREKILLRVADGAAVATASELAETRGRATDTADLAEIAAARDAAAQAAVNRAEIETMRTWTADFHDRVAGAHAEIFALAQAFDVVLAQARDALRAFQAACAATDGIQRESREFVEAHLANAVAANPIVAAMHPSQRPSVGRQVSVYQGSRADVRLQIMFTDGSAEREVHSVAAIVSDCAPAVRT
jgi:hypothetical protein